MLRRIAISALLALALAACGQQAQVQRPTAAQAGGAVEPVFAFSEAVVGPNRLALGLVRNGSPVNDPGAQVKLRFFDLSDTNAQPQGETQAIYYGRGLPAAVYVAYPTFSKAGEWGIEVTTTLSGQSEPSVRRLRLEVRERSSAPMVGDKAISVKTLTPRDVPDPSYLSSGKVEDLALYQVSLDEALASGKPTALLFATPAFCRTAVCGPSLQVVQALQKRYGGQVNFIHVEVYRHPFSESFRQQEEVFRRLAEEGRAPTEEERRVGLSDAMAAWNLPSEPWLFLIDAQGTIVARYEGGITEEEIGPAIEKLAAGQPIQEG
ncbi:MAG TPA: thioredoxin family protein [Roseiflexaceae bacterium]|nr:thioredoxin family protein [Roseiflexaceae bacterium]